MLHHGFHGNLQPAGEEFSNTKSMSFDGVNEWIDMGTASELEFGIAEAFSVSIWVKTTNSGSRRIMSRLSSAATNPGWQAIMIASGVWRFQLIGTTSGRITVESGSSLIDDGNWHHLVATYDGSDDATGVTLYIDGSSVSDTDTENDLVGDITNTGPMNVGAIRNITSVTWDGNLDEPSVWDKELSSGEVSDIYNSGAAADLSEHSAAANLVGWWRLGDSTDSITTIVDRSSNSNDGTPTNMESGDIVSDVSS